MDQLHEYFYLTISNDRMLAQIYCKDTYQNSGIEIDEGAIRHFLDEHKIVYGIEEQSIQLLLSNLSSEKFPFTIAKGKPAINGKDGKIRYTLNFTNEIDRTPNWNFRDVMRIPSVKKGQKLATILVPSEGEDGINVSGNTIQAKPGKPTAVKAGKNVVYREEDMSFYATSEGQLSMSGRYIQIQPVYEVNETLSMKNGNLDFVGTIIIRGDVPTGYTVKAEGDIKIYGMVEAATVIAGGSIYIAEGLSGQKKGYIKANENINIGYINQGTAFAGNNLYVENSILHSECIAKKHVFCQRGNIIGGSLSAGKSVEAKDIGNRLSTKTEVIFGVNKSIEENEKNLLAKKKELQETLAKLTTLGEKLKSQDITQNPKLRITMLRQRNSYNNTKEQIEEIDKTLEQTNSHIGSEREAQLIVRNFLYTNVIVAFGKYKRIINTNHHYVQMKLDKNEIAIQPLFN